MFVSFLLIVTCVHRYLILCCNVDSKNCKYVYTEYLSLIMGKKLLLHKKQRRTLLTAVH